MYHNMSGPTEATQRFLDNQARIQQSRSSFADPYQTPVSAQQIFAEEIKIPIEAILNLTTPPPDTMEGSPTNNYGNDLDPSKLDLYNPEIRTYLKKRQKILEHLVLISSSSTPSKSVFLNACRTVPQSLHLKELVGDQEQSPEDLLSSLDHMQKLRKRLESINEMLSKPADHRKNPELTPLGRIFARLADFNPLRYFGLALPFKGLTTLTGLLYKRVFFGNDSTVDILKKAGPITRFIIGNSDTDMILAKGKTVVNFNGVKTIADLVKNNANLAKFSLRAALPLALRSLPYVGFFVTLASWLYFEYPEEVDKLKNLKIYEKAKECLGVEKISILYDEC